MEHRKPPRRSDKRGKRRRKVDQSKTALGETPEKRSRKSDGSSKGDSAPRTMASNVKTAKYRSYSSTNWLKRQLNDPFVARAKAEGWRSRAAFKLLEINERYRLIRPDARVVDLGCAPGGWCQVASKAVGDRGQVVGIDYLNVPAIQGVEILELDFTDDSAPGALKDLLDGDADVVLSDMAAPTTGHKSTDHLRIVALAELALDFATDVLAPGGAFVAKVFSGGAEGELLQTLRQNFETVRHVKPKASRQESAEKYVVATGFRGRKQ